MPSHTKGQLERLAEQIRAIEQAGWAGACKTSGETVREGGVSELGSASEIAALHVATGWAEVDRVLGGSGRKDASGAAAGEALSTGVGHTQPCGLRRGALHEWFGMAAADAAVESADSAIAESGAGRPASTSDAGVADRDERVSHGRRSGLEGGGRPARGGRRRWGDLDAWTPPLCLLVHLAWQALTGQTLTGQTRDSQALTTTDDAWSAVGVGEGTLSAGRGGAGAGGAVVWIGRRCWPHPRVMVRRDPGDGGSHEAEGRQLLQHSLFADPTGVAARLWAVDLALRSPAVTAVVADGSGFDMAATRRLQLAAESGRGLALLARPPHELSELSVAVTRWVVAWARSPDAGVRESPTVGASAVRGPAVGATASTCEVAKAVADTAVFRPRWRLVLQRCRSQRTAVHTDHHWTLEWKRDRFVVVASSELVGRPGHASREEADTVEARRTA